MAIRQGVISASIIIILLVAAIVGAIVGLLLENIAPDTRVLAIAAGFLATIIASIVRYAIIFRGAGAGRDESRVPTVLLVNAAIASIAGSLAAHDVANLYSPVSSVALGTLAGIFSAVLMALLMITYHSNSAQRG